MVGIVVILEPEGTELKLAVCTVIDQLHSDPAPDGMIQQLKHLQAAGVDCKKRQP
ncbi:hypothetical protein D3C81_2049040 [compost metagenome]